MARGAALERRGIRDCSAKLTTTPPRLLFGFLAQLMGEFPELVQRRVDADERELALDHLQVEFPDVGEDPPHPSGRVVPSLAGGSGPVVSAAHGHENCRLALEDGLGAAAIRGSLMTVSTHVLKCCETPKL